MQNNFGARSSHSASVHPNNYSNDDEQLSNLDENQDEAVELEPSSLSSTQSRKYDESARSAPSHLLQLQQNSATQDYQTQISNENLPQRLIHNAQAVLPFVQQPNQSTSSALVQQFSNKIKAQAILIQQMEEYKDLCEQKLVEAGYNLPIAEESEPEYQQQQLNSNNNQVQELKKQLALKEQDLMYARMRTEKAVSECEQLKKESYTTSGISNDAVQLHNQVKILEEEKNALLDYIEEMEQKSQQNPDIQIFIQRHQQEIQQLRQTHQNQITDLQLMMQDQQRVHNGSLGGETFGGGGSKDHMIVLDLQKQLEQTRRAYDTLNSEKLNMQIQFDRINDEDRITQLESQNKDLQETLIETQSEFEQLIGDHENLQRQLNEVRGQLSHALKVPAGLKQEYNQLNQEQQLLRQSFEQAQMQIQVQSEEAVKLSAELKESQQKRQQLQQQVQLLEKQSQDHAQQIQMEWETSVENLKGALQMAKGELTEKELNFHQVEKDLRSKLAEIEASRDQKSKLMRRVEDLQSEMTSLKSAKDQKDSKLQQQIVRNQDLLNQLENLNYELSKARADCENTIALQQTNAHELESTKAKAKKQSKVIDKLCAQIRLASEILDQMLKDCGLEDTAKPRSNELDYLKQLPDQLTLIAAHINRLQNDKEQLTHELKQHELKIQNLEIKYTDVLAGETQARDKQSFLLTEVDTLKQQLQQVEGDKKQSYQREDRIQRSNQQIKTQLDICRKEQEKIVSQMKVQAVKEQQLIQDLDEATAQINELTASRQDLEVDRQRFADQLELTNSFMAQVQNQFSSKYVREVFGEILKSLDYGLKLDIGIQQIEAELYQKEAELRQWASQDNTQLNEEVCQLRIQVEQGRLKLKDLLNKQGGLQKERERLISDLKCTEQMERRRDEVAHDTEISMAKLLEENMALKGQINFEQQSSQQFKVMVQAAQDEKQILLREIGALRDHMKFQAYSGSKQNPRFNQGAPLRSPQNDQINLQQLSENFNLLNMNNQMEQSAKPPLSSNGFLATQVTSAQPGSNNPPQNDHRTSNAFLLPPGNYSVRSHQHSREASIGAQNRDARYNYMPRQVLTSQRSRLESSDDELNQNTQTQPCQEEHHIAQESFAQGDHSRSSSVHLKINHLQNIFQQMRRNLTEQHQL